MKKPLFLTVVLALMLQVTSFGQSIKLNNQNDPGSAMLEVNSPSKGILIPNVSLTGSTDATTITLPAVSLLVYNTATVSDVEPGYYYNSGTPVSPFWTRLSTKAYVDVLLEQILELQLVTGVKIKDIDGNVYKIITIGTQTWMAENLKTIKYNDGTVIPLITDGWYTASLNSSPGYCWYGAPNESTNLTTYGALYNWYAIDTLSNGNKNVCPTGWHVPTDGEWTTLTDALGGTVGAGGKMKEAGLAHWKTPNTGATNESGFAGLPGGYRRQFNEDYAIGGDVYWWSYSEGVPNEAWYRNLTYNNGNVSRYDNNKGSGMSVRCLRD
jgi:uncharacterized protein (TIGR02145 family)